MDDGFKQGLFAATLFWLVIGAGALMAIYHQGMYEGKARVERRECYLRGGIAVADTFGDVQCATKKERM